MTLDPTRGWGKVVRRFDYVGQAVRAAARPRPGPAPGTDAEWATQLEQWLERQAEVLVADVEDDLAGRPTPCPDLVGRARRLWSLAHLHRHGRGGAAVATAVPRAREALDRHADEAHGGWVWAVDPDGSVTDARKALYGQSVAVLALAELALAGGRPAVGARAHAEVALALAATPVTRHGAVPELLADDWAPLPPGTVHPEAVAGVITIGGQLHLFEAAALLAAAGAGSAAADIARRAAEVLDQRFLGPDGAAATDEAGAALPHPVSLGHRIEAAWLLAEGAEWTGLAGARETCRRHVEGAITEGFRHGSQDDRPWPGFRFGGRQRIWWVQVELLRALVEFDDGPDGRLRGILVQVLAWLHRNQVDPRTGQAWQLMTDWGAVLVTGDGTSARTGYHDIRAYVAAADLLAGRRPAPEGPHGHR